MIAALISLVIILFLLWPVVRSSSGLVQRMSRADSCGPGGLDGSTSSGESRGTCRGCAAARPRGSSAGLTARCTWPSTSCSTACTVASRPARKQVLGVGAPGARPHQDPAAPGDPDARPR